MSIDSEYNFLTPKFNSDFAFSQSQSQWSSFSLPFFNLNFSTWTLPKIDFSKVFTFNNTSNICNNFNFSTNFSTNSFTNFTQTPLFNFTPSFNFDSFTASNSITSPPATSVSSASSIAGASASTMSSASRTSSKYKIGDTWHGHRITSLYGYRKAPTVGASINHKGVDLAYGYQENIYAFAEGTVVNVVNGAKGYGNYVDIKTPDGVVNRYAHCYEISVEVGDKVDKNTSIALAGSTGISTGTHLHFETIVNGQKVNPLSYSALA